MSGVTWPSRESEKRSQLFPLCNRDDVSDHKILGWVEHSHLLTNSWRQWGSDPVKHPEGWFPTCSQKSVVTISRVVHKQKARLCHWTVLKISAMQLMKDPKVSVQFPLCKRERRKDLAISWLDETHVPSLGCPSLSGSADKMVANLLKPWRFHLRNIWGNPWVARIPGFQFLGFRTEDHPKRCHCAL